MDFVKHQCPMERMGRDGELDGALLLLASDASSYKLKLQVKNLSLWRSPPAATEFPEPGKLDRQPP